MSEYSAIPIKKQKGLINLILFLVSIAIVVYVGMTEPGMTFLEVAGYTIIVSSCYLLLYLFIFHFRKEILEVSRKILFILAVILAFVIITKFVIAEYRASIIFLVPYALIPIVIRSFYDARLAMFILLITLMLSGFIVPGPFEFIFMNLLAGIVAILSLSDINRKYKLIFSSFTVTITYMVIYLAFAIRQTGTVSVVELAELKLFIGNGLLLLSGYPVISIFEKKFYFLSDTTMH